MGDAVHLSVVVADLGRFAQQSPFIAHARETDVVVVDRRCPAQDLARYLLNWLGGHDAETMELVLTDLDRVDCDAGAHDWRPAETATVCVVCGVVEVLPDRPLPVFDRLICV